MAYADKVGIIEPLLTIMRRLRDPDSGCPWDLKQTLQSVVSYTIEEAYEVHDAVQRNSMGDLKEELGDLLLQVVFQAQIAHEQAEFDFNDVVESICDKMVRRHPHVFAANHVQCEPSAIKESWELIKEQERRLKHGEQRDSLLENVEVHLPPLQRAVKLQKAAAKVNFDWSGADQVDAKLVEEIHELTEARKQRDHDRVIEEYGDVLFTLINLARHLQVDPEQGLYRANIKFQRRFQQMEKIAAEEGKELSRLNAQEWDLLWRRVKDDAS